MTTIFWETLTQVKLLLHHKISQKKNVQNVPQPEQQFLERLMCCKLILFILCSILQGQIPNFIPHLNLVLFCSNFVAGARTREIQAQRRVLLGNNMDFEIRAQSIVTYKYRPSFRFIILLLSPKIFPFLLTNAKSQCFVNCCKLCVHRYCFDKVLFSPKLQFCSVLPQKVLELRIMHKVKYSK